jgi:hypothetical protein
VVKLELTVRVFAAEPWVIAEVDVWLAEDAATAP